MYSLGNKGRYGKTAELLTNINIVLDVSYGFWPGQVLLLILHWFFFFFFSFLFWLDFITPLK